MLRTIVEKEILDHLKSAKFLISVALTAVLVVISTGINTREYEQRHQDFLNAQKELKGNGFEFVLLRAPQVLSTLIQGKDRILGNKAQVSSLRLPSSTSGYMGEDWSLHSSFVAGFASVDYAFVVRVVLSLVVLFLAYNVISEEKVRGTLKLMLSNPVPRDRILLGKFLGGIAVVGSAIFIATAIALILLVLDPAVVVGPANWIRIVGIVGFSCLYLIFFFALGLCVSVLVDRPSTALMVLLQAWIFLVILYPNFATSAAASLRPLPSAAEIDGQKQALFEPTRGEFDRVSKKLEDAVRANTHDAETSNRWRELWVLRQELDWRVEDELRRRQNQQARLAEWLGFLSPAVLYERVVTDYAGTNLADYDRFMDGVYRFWKELADNSPKVSSTPKGGPKPPPPTFAYQPGSLKSILAATVPEWSVLSMMSLGLFVAAYAGFLRKDVR